MNEPHHPADARDDSDLAALLRAAGPRARPSAAMVDAVRAAVESEWRSVVAARRRRRRQVTTWGLAAGIAVAGVAVWLARPLYLVPSGPVASLARVDGGVLYRHAGDTAWAPLSAGATLQPGDALRTGSDSRVALTLASGVDLRLDRGSELALTSTHHAALREGSVYVDSGAALADASRDLEVETPVGTVTHLGTQYEARLSDGSLRVGVREGRVKIATGPVRIDGEQGQQITVRDGEVIRSSVPASSESWAWVSEITPPFAIDGRSVDDFLAWAARETGREVTYLTPEAAHRAETIILRGSVAGLHPDAAVAAVLATTTLRPSIDRERIVVEAVSP